MKFTKERREGLARLLDTLAASAVIGALLGISGRSSMSGIEIAALIFVCILLIFCSLLLRGSNE